jgi:hypothetical protein
MVAGRRLGANCCHFPADWLAGEFPEKPPFA